MSSFKDRVVALQGSERIESELRGLLEEALSTTLAAPDAPVQMSRIRDFEAGLELLADEALVERMRWQVRERLASLEPAPVVDAQGAPLSETARALHGFRERVLELSWTDLTSLPDEVLSSLIVERIPSADVSGVLSELWPHLGESHLGRVLIELARTDHREAQTFALKLLTSRYEDARLDGALALALLNDPRGESTMRELIERVAGREEIKMRGMLDLADIDDALSALGDSPAAMRMRRLIADKRSRPEQGR